MGEEQFYIYESLSGMFPSDIITGHFAHNIYAIGMAREATPREIDNMKLIDKGLMTYEQYQRTY